MKNLITPEEVKARATSPESALEVSDEVWEQRCEMDYEETKKIQVSPKTCGLCMYYGIDKGVGTPCNKNGHGICILWESDTSHNCCREFVKVGQFLEKYSIGEVTYSEVKSAIYAMKTRLEREKAKLLKEEKKEAKPKIRHGDYGLGEDNHKRIAVRQNRCEPIDVYNEMGCKNPGGRNPEKDLWVGNLFDELEGMDAEMTEFNGKSRFGGDYLAKADGKDVYIRASDACLTPAGARRFARAILVLCANAERGGK